MAFTSQVDLPRSAVPVSDGLLGLAGLAVGWMASGTFSLGPVASAWCVLLGASLPMLWAERRRLPPGWRAASAKAPASWFAGTVILLLLAYLVHAQHGEPSTWVVVALVVTPAYIIRASLLERSSWFSGAAADTWAWLIGRGPAPQRTALHIGIMKAFFIPIYTLSLVSLLNVARALSMDDIANWLLFAVIAGYVIDLSFALAGYVFASNNLVPSIRDTNTSMLGWAVCLLCYPPLSHYWSAALSVARLEIRWPELTAASPDFIVTVGAVGMLMAMAIYIPATVVFGLRFSNLTNRGVVTTGPYRWFKHPAYMAHIVNAWIIVIIFLPASGMTLKWELVMVPVAYTILYSMRMKTEEMHMRQDPEYVRYEEWIANHGFLPRAKRMIRALFARLRSARPSVSQ